MNRCTDRHGLEGYEQHPSSSSSCIRISPTANPNQLSFATNAEYVAKTLPEQQIFANVMEAPDVIVDKLDVAPVRMFS